VTATPTVNLYYDQGGSAAFALGRLTKMTDGVGSETYTYNLLGQMTQLQKLIGATTYTTSYAYNLARELSSITYPSNRVVQQSFDTIGRLCAVGNSGSTCSSGTTFATGYTYNAAFRVTGFNYGNGVSAAIGYTADRLLLQSLAYTKGATTLFSTNYWYKTDSTNCPSGASGNNGQIQCITDNVDSGRTVSYAFDALYRLTSATTSGSTNYPKWGLSMNYDRYGNRSSQSVSSGCVAPMVCPTNSVGIDATTNRINTSGYAYDANGNMTNDGNNTLVYDAENRLLSATNGSTSGTYSYDGNSLRVKKVSGSTTTVYIFSGTKVIAEYDNGAAVGAPSREHIYSGSSLLAKIEGSTTKYFHPDHLSTRVITDSSGNILEQHAHYPFGEPWYDGPDKWKFTSYERDGESGNDFARMRFGVNRLGRFSSPDPMAGSVASPQSLNRYAYVRNDPINLSDPTGMGPLMYVCSPGDPIGISGCFPWGYHQSSGGGAGSLFMGNDIFDAIAGEPGTYIYVDMYGNLSFGFSVDLWQATFTFIDQTRTRLAHSPESPKPADIDYQVYIRNSGSDIVISGFIPDLLAASQEGWQAAGKQPNAPEDLNAALKFFLEQIIVESAANIDEPFGAALRDMYMFFPDTESYFQALDLWLSNYVPYVAAVYKKYPGVLR
jgi:RHS repeat-associated protein